MIIIPSGVGLAALQLCPHLCGYVEPPRAVALPIRTLEAALQVQIILVHERGVASEGAGVVRRLDLHPLVVARTQVQCM